MELKKKPNRKVLIIFIDFPKLHNVNTDIYGYILSIYSQRGRILAVEFFISNDHGTVLFIKIIITVSHAITSKVQWNAFPVSTTKLSFQALKYKHGLLTKDS